MPYFECAVTPEQIKFYLRVAWWDWVTSCDHFCDPIFYRWIEGVAQIALGCFGFVANAVAIPILLSREMRSIFNRWEWWKDKQVGSICINIHPQPFWHCEWMEERGRLFWRKSPEKGGCEFLMWEGKSCVNPFHDRVAILIRVATLKWETLLY